MKIFDAFRPLAAALLAATVFSCEMPESERVPEVFTVTPSTTSPTALESSITVDVRCDLNWNASVLDPSWGSVTVVARTEGSGGKFTFQMGENTAEEARENTLVVKAGKEEKRITITQGGMATFFNPRALQLGGGVEETSLLFTSPAAWWAQIAEGADWLKLVTASGGPGPARVIVASKEANENVGSREGTLRITIGESNYDIPVTQGQKDVILTDNTSLELGFEGQEIHVRTLYNVDYKVEASASWITHTGSKAPLHEGSETFVLEENAAPDTRKGEIVFSSEGHPDAKLVLTILQGGKDPVLNITQPGFYGIDGKDYVWEAGLWKQRSRLVSANRNIRYRLLDGTTLSVAQLEGMAEKDQPGESVKLHFTLTSKWSNVLSKDFTAAVLYRKDGLVWYKSADGAYFIINE